MEDSLKKIIAVDDVNVHLLTIKERIGKQYDVYPAQTATILEEILEHITPDLILLDINMPEVNGYDILRNLKSARHTKEIPVILFSASNDSKSIKKGMNLGAADFIAKPYTVQHLVECIEYQLSPEKQAANRPIILAVDDNPSILKSLNALLEDKYDVYTLPDSNKFNGLMTLIKPDLFLLDCNMPGLSGFDLVPLIRKIPEHGNTPIILITTDGILDNVYVASGLGVSDFIVKPFDDKMLREKIDHRLADYVIRRRLRKCEG
jgi:DNA-binding response OmpR family regulator